ncbi:MAG: hypothetical protein PUK55_02630 [Clostridiales bacterium]|nr:hypothetical protein [Clostridiales bacterium]
MQADGPHLVDQRKAVVIGMNWMPTLTTFLMVSQASEKKVVIPFQMFVKVVETEFHTSSQLVPNQPRTVSATF